MTSHKTAIKRTKLSAPAKELKPFIDSLGSKRKNFCVLDYGCGHGFDAETLGYQKFDPYYFPTRPKGKYDVIVCNYVLNVQPDVESIRQILKDIQSLLKPNSVALITVRDDNFKSGKTTKGFQYKVGLDLFKLVHKKGSFKTWTLPHDKNIDDLNITIN